MRAAPCQAGLPHNPAAPGIQIQSTSTVEVQVLELMELEAIRGALVGEPGVSGLSVEQRKRLTIGASAAHVLSGPARSAAFGSSSCSAALMAWAAALRLCGVGARRPSAQCSSRKLAGWGAAEGCRQCGR